jgi:hypothetical protein
MELTYLNSMACDRYALSSGWSHAYVGALTPEVRRVNISPKWTSKCGGALGAGGGGGVAPTTTVGGNVADWHDSGQFCIIHGPCFPTQYPPLLSCWHTPGYLSCRVAILFAIEANEKKIRGSRGRARNRPPSIHWPLKRKWTSPKARRPRCVTNRRAPVRAAPNANHPGIPAVTSSNTFSLELV